MRVIYTVDTGVRKITVDVRKVGSWVFVPRIKHWFRGEDFDTFLRRLARNGSVQGKRVM